MACYRLSKDGSSEPQQANDSCYIGGKPRLPEWQEIPQCSLCGNSLTFYFQIAFPLGCSWEGRTLSVFACTDCADEDHFIPVPYEDHERFRNVPLNAMNMRGSNYSVMVFKTDQTKPVTGYRERVLFRRWRLRQCRDGAKGTKLGGVPNWIYELEAPLMCDSKWEMEFLMQLEPDFQFAVLDDAPRQVIYSFLQDAQVPANREHYELFLGNGLYVFGAKVDGKEVVYLESQKA